MQRGRFQILTAVLLVAALVMGGASLTGCSDDDSSVPNELLATWLLQLFSLDDGSTTQVANPADYTVEFMADETARIKADCNLCNGRFFIDGDMLRFGTMACTLAACPPGSLDSAFVAALATTSRYEIVDGRLILYYQGGSLTLAR